MDFGRIVTDGQSFDQIKIGECVEQKRAAALRDVLSYLGAADDYNPLYLTENYAGQTKFGRVIVPPGLIISWLTALISTRLPGPGSVIKEMKLNIPGVVHPNEEMELHLEVAGKMEKGKQVIVKAMARRGEQVILDGEFSVVPPEPLKPLHGLLDNF
ncbi:MAG: MaoC/PaaZ C-terminal domain-containing protein [Thermoactinomyces sp.]